ncbi:MAG: riboflavin synthase subunit alpha [Gammaproteobacteria bacterium]|nr:MAG: riboflavin synthase subunit alpha [Gammaproteobacteria bacterium]
MFTGIVQELAQVVAIRHEAGITQLEIALSTVARRGLEGGASVAINGTCLTVARQCEDSVGFDVIAETMARTNLGDLTVDAQVNVERSAAFGDEIGGHAVSGHITGVARISAITRDEANCVMRFEVDREWLRMLFHKGFVALDGASLTISAIDRDAACIEVSLIPETLARTTLGARGVGDRVNLEVDPQTQAIVETVERLFLDPEWRQQILP